MSTHVWYCAVCGKQTTCCDDAHALGSGRGNACNYDREEGLPLMPVRDGEFRDPPIEFCSLACFTELQESMAKRLEIAKELYPEWWGGKPRRQDW